MSDTNTFKPVDTLLEELVADENGLPGVIVIVLDRQGSDIAVHETEIQEEALTTCTPIRQKHLRAICRQDF